MINSKKLFEHILGLIASNSPLLQMEIDSVEKHTDNGNGLGAIWFSFGSTNGASLVEEHKKDPNGAFRLSEEIFVSKCRGFPKFEKDRSKTERIPGTEHWGTATQDVFD